MFFKYICFLISSYIKRRVNGLNTDSFIAQKVFKGVDSTFEWYFLTDGWNRPDVKDKTIPTPVRLIITLYKPILNNEGVEIDKV